MKKVNKIVLGALLLTTLFSIISFSNASAADIPVIASDNVPFEAQVQAHVRTTYRFQNQTRLTINSSVDCDMIMICEASKIGEKYFEIQIVDAPHDLQMNMTCTEEQAELGLLLGTRHTARNRNRYVYQEAFCVALKCNATSIQARLMILATAQNGGGTWAYYDEANGEWVSVPTTIENGYLVATTNHFSTWTVLIPEVDILPYIIVGVIIGIIAAISVVGIVIYKKKR
ncbi:MAG: hypothetical protein ACFFBP_16910 [Promethearchaeota archaeon]